MKTIRALLQWFGPTEIYEPSGREWLKALRQSGYRASFVKLPAATVRCMQNTSRL